MAEQFAWDGFFIWDHVNPDPQEVYQVVDPWITLSAVATQTEKLRIGSTVTPLTRRRPTKVARETATLDILSNGRMTLGVGLGEPASTEFEFMGEDSDPKIRAEKLDEALRIITGLWTGKPFSFNGKHFKVREATFLPQPTQKPRIPIWVGGYWPNKPPFCRAAKYDGVFPIAEDRISPEELRKVIKFVKTHRRSELHSK